MAASLVPTEGGSPFTLDKPIILIGRHQECDITLQTSSKVSRRHCCIVQVGERFVLRDLGSMNGIRVNGHRIIETELCPGDEVAVADVMFTFRRDDVAVRPSNPTRGERSADRRSPGTERKGLSPFVNPADFVSPADDDAPLPDEPEEGYDPRGGLDEDDVVRLNDDSHSAEHGFVSV
jgi:pSer/pThr/pTyr-binding forkhead associated (FHA) protein